MKRRTLVRKLGAAGIGAAAISGTAAARRPPVSDIGIDRELDVSSVEGETTLEQLLEPQDVAELPADVDLSRRVTVAAKADVITLGDCCEYCPFTAVEDCDQLCYCCVENCGV